MPYIQRHTNISDISVELLDSEILVNGWIRNIRIQSNLAFVEIYDGSTSKSIQAISEDSKINELIKPLSIGSSISLKAIVAAIEIASNWVTIKSYFLITFSVSNNKLVKYSSEIFLSFKVTRSVIDCKWGDSYKLHV